MRGYLKRPLLRLGISAALIVGGLVGLYCSYELRRVERALDDHGAVVDARVVRGWTRTRRGRRSSFLEVRYPVAGRPSPTATIEVPEEIYARHVDDRDDVVAPNIEVRFLPEEPDEVRVVGHDDDPRVGFALSAVVIVLGAVSAIATLRKLARD